MRISLFEIVIVIEFERVLRFASRLGSLSGGTGLRRFETASRAPPLPHVTSGNPTALPLSWILLLSVTLLLRLLLVLLILVAVFPLVVHLRFSLIILIIFI